jgi:phage terminase large subunit GpA-like protein
MDEEFYQQLCSERRTPIKRRDGSIEYRWVRTPGVRNEVLDTTLYADAGAIRQGWRTMTPDQWDQLAAVWQKPVEKGQLDIEDLAVETAPAKTAPQAAPQPAAQPQGRQPSRFRQATRWRQ